jgi:predicted lipid-binding transport protein (Tim44 family)
VIVGGLGATAAAALGRVAAVPLDPDADDARRLLLDELGEPEYEAARPNALDLAAQAVGDWLAGLLGGAGGGLASIAPVVIVALVLAVVVVAFLVFGAPRRDRRRAAERGDGLFGSDDRRSAEELRRAADAARRAGDLTAAVSDLFRAIAREQAERTIVAVDPGTTARGFARRAGSAHPAHAARLVGAADDFDAVRYLGRAGTDDMLDRLAALDRDLRTAVPVLREPVGAGSA